MSITSTTLSVAICTYNGERYLAEQLTSIDRQTVLPDEVVVVDDGSSDGSVAFLRQWAQTVSFPVHIHQNPINVGSTKSFEKALSLCTGDLITLSDQDDIWLADRLAKTKAWFAAHPDMQAVFSDAELIGEDSQPTGHRIWELVQFTPEARRRWQRGRGYELLFSGYIVTGATISIRRTGLGALLPFPTHVEYLIHDAWISLILALQGKIGFIDEPLIRYRQHNRQQVGFKANGPKVTLLDRLRRSHAARMAPIERTARRYEQLRALLAARPDIDPRQLRRLHRMTDHLTRRTSLPRVRLLRIPYVMNELVRGNYQLFPGHWWLTVLGDLVEN